MQVLIMINTSMSKGCLTLPFDKEVTYVAQSNLLYPQTKFN